jgi:hypothetical protein
MSYSPENSRIVLSPSETEHVKTLLPEQIKSYMREIALRDHLVSEDLDPNILIENLNPPERAAQFTKAITVNGRTLKFEGDSELAVEQAIGDYLRGEVAAREEATTTTRQAATTVATESAEQVAERVELELQFKRGTISASEYIEKSGVLDTYLQSRGVSVEDLQEVTQQRGSERFERSWADATSAFLNGPEGADWPGGDANRDTLGRIIVQEGLFDAEDKVQALAAAYAFAQEHKLLVDNPETKIASANSVDDMRRALGRSPDYSSIYGGR